MKTIAEIAASLQGYDPQSLHAVQVTAFLEQLVQPVQDCETVELHVALGRVLASDVVSPISVPPHDNSAMDGYAFDGAQLQAGKALRLRVIGAPAFAGAAWRGAVAAGECVRIMTGAIMPAGLDTVAPQELTQAEGEFIRIAPDVLRAGDNRRFAGEDLMRGAVALGAGEPISPAALGLLASLGLPRATVRRRLRVAVFSTGDEILRLGEAPREGAVYDSNRYTLLGLLTRLDVELIDLGVVPDEPTRLRAAFASAAAQADAVITSGGVSVGEADHTRSMMRELGDVAFWRIAMRPGRPMAVGRIARDKLWTKLASSAYSVSISSSQYHSKKLTGEAILFGLPGNPVAVMVTFLAFVRPALLRMMGCTRAAPPLLRARSAESIRKKPGRTEYQRGLVRSGADGQLEVRITGNQGSGVLSSMVQANGLIVLPHNSGNVAAGDVVEVMVFDGVM